MEAHSKFGVRVVSTIFYTLLIVLSQRSYGGFSSATPLFLAAYQWQARRSQKHFEHAHRKRRDRIQDPIRDSVYTSGGRYRKYLGVHSGQ